MTYNLAHGGNNFVYDATRKYMVGAHVAGDEDDTVTAFNKARDLAIEVMRNNGIVKQGSHGWVQVTDNTITADTTSPVCIAVASSITTLMGIATGALGTTASPGTLANFEATCTRTIPATALDGYANGCVNQVSAITNFMKIITDTLQDPTAANPATYQWASSVTYLVSNQHMRSKMVRHFAAPSTHIRISPLVDSSPSVMSLLLLPLVQPMTLSVLMLVTSGSIPRTSLAPCRQMST